MISILWKQSKILTATAALMLLDFVGTLIGIGADPRLITGAPAWLKPAKFAISTAIFAATIAWLSQYLPTHTKALRWLGSAIAVILLIEVAIIDFQAARGTTSHFNVGTVQDSILYSIMGTSIGILWLLSIWIAILLFRQTFQDPAWGWALRLGMILSVLGSASGGLMTMPSSSQRAMIAEHEHVTVLGAHTVGAPDGGPGIAGVGWSKDHGDLRIPHFLGLHAIQLIPFLVWWRGRYRTNHFVFAISASYLVLFLLLLWQALRGESIDAPGPLTLLALGGWLAATIVALLPIRKNRFRRVEVSA